MTIKENLAAITEEINAACQRVKRNPNEITVVAVTKYVSEQTANAAIDAGIKHLGENRDDHFIKKWEAIGDKVTWHFIGTLQSRKVKQVIDKVDYIHSLDRLSLAKEIDKRATRQIKCFVQVNVSGEASKHGLDEEEVVPFIEKLQEYENIQVVGLMTMAPNTNDEDKIREVFRKLKTLQQTIRNLNILHAPCHELSMGMSNDFSTAVEEGATFIRLGSSLVGKEDE